MRGVLICTSPILSPGHVTQVFYVSDGCRERVKELREQEKSSDELLQNAIKQWVLFIVMIESKTVVIWDSMVVNNKSTAEYLVPEVVSCNNLYCL